MRTRTRSDWVTDLEDRHDLESAVGRALEHHSTVGRVRWHTNRVDRCDFTVTVTGRPVEVELKAKRQRYVGWHAPGVAERDLFILDELALRRIVASGPFTQLLIRDVPADRWVIFGVPDLVLAPKIRVDRLIHRNRPVKKGKVLLDLTDGHQVPDRGPGDAVEALVDQIVATRRDWNQVEPWPTPQKAS